MEKQDLCANSAEEGQYIVSVRKLIKWNLTFVFYLVTYTLLHCKDKLTEIVWFINLKDPEVICLPEYFS